MHTTDANELKRTLDEINRARGRQIKRALEDVGSSFAAVGRQMHPPLTRQHVRDVAFGRTPSRPVQRALARALGWNPWADSNAEPAA